MTTLKKPGLRFVLAQLYKAVRKEWLGTAFLSTFTAYAFVRLGFVTGLGWLIATISFVAATWFAMEAKEGWELVLKLQTEELERIRREGTL